MESISQCLPYCLCSKNASGICPDRMAFEEKKTLLALFISLKMQGSVSSFVTVEDVIDWFLRQERKAFMQWFSGLKQAGGVQACLIWEVNAHLRMQDIEREVKRDLLARRLAGVSHEGSELKDFRQHISPALSDPKSSGSANVDIQKSPDEFKMPLIKRIISDLEQELQHHEFTCLHSQLEIVADIVTRILFIMRIESSGTYNGSSMDLIKLAMVIVRAVLRNLSSVCTNMHAHYSHPAAKRITHSVHKKLVKSLYTSDDMKEFLTTTKETLMASVIEHVSGKVSKLFQQPTLSAEPPSVLRLFMTASDHRSSPTTGEKLVIYNDTVASVVTLVLLQLYSEEDTEEEFVFQSHNWHLVDYVVNRLGLSGVKVTKKKSKVTCYFNMNEVVCMVNSISEELLTRYDDSEFLVEALDCKSWIVSKDIGDVVSCQLMMVCQNRRTDTPPFEALPCLDLDNVICGVVARFVDNLVLVTMDNRERLILCLLLVDQLRFLTDVGLTQILRSSSLAGHLKELPSELISQLGDMVYHQYLDAYPLQDVEDQLHTLADTELSSAISNMIIKTLLDYANQIWNISHEADKECHTSASVRPPPGFLTPGAFPVVQPLLGLGQPSVKPPPGFAVPEAALADNTPLGLALPNTSTALKPPPGLAVPEVTVCPTSGLCELNASPAVQPPPGFGPPNATPAVKTPPALAVPGTTPAVRPLPGFIAPAVKPPPGFVAPGTSTNATSVVKPPPGFAVLEKTSVVKPPPGFAVSPAAPAIPVQSGSALAVSYPSAAVKAPGFTLPEATNAMQPPPDTPHALRPVPGISASNLSLNVQQPPGFSTPDASPAVQPPPGFAPLKASPAVKPPPGFVAPGTSTNATSVVKPPLGFAVLEKTSVVKPPPGFAVSPAAPAIPMQSGSALAVSYPSAAVKAPGFTLTEATNAVQPPPDTPHALHPVPGISASDLSLNVQQPPGFSTPDASPAVQPSPGFAPLKASPAVKPPPGFVAPGTSTNATSVVKPPPGFDVLEKTSVVKPPSGFAVPGTSATVMLPPGIILPEATSSAKPPAGLVLTETSVPIQAPPGISHLQCDQLLSFMSQVLHLQCDQLLSIMSQVLHQQCDQLLGFLSQELHQQGSPSASPHPGSAYPTAAWPSPGFSLPVSTPVVRPPAGFFTTEASPAVKLPQMVSTPDSAKQQPAEFSHPDVSQSDGQPPRLSAPDISLALGPLSVSNSDVSPALKPSSCTPLERTHSKVCSEVLEGALVDESDVRINHTCDYNKSQAITLNNAPTEAHSLPEKVKTSKKRGLKGFLQKMKRAFLCNHQ